MRLPWVSRLQHDALSAVYERTATQRDDLARELVAAQAREAAAVAAVTAWREQLARAEHLAATQYGILLERYHSLRLAGGNEPTALPAAVVRKDAPDELVLAVHRASQGNPVLRRQMLQQLQEDRDNPTLTDADILKRINDGVDGTIAGIFG